MRRRIPGVWNPDLRPGDNKWSITLFARDPDNGHAKWAYQFVKHDAWDYDEIMENVLVDMPFNGQPRKLLDPSGAHRVRLHVRPHDGRAAQRREIPADELGTARGYEDG